MSLDGVTLTASFTIVGDRLEVHFRVTNGRAEDIYLIDTAFKAGATGVEIRTDHLQVSYEAPDTAVLSSTLPTLDPTIQWATPPSVYGTRVAAKQTYENTLGAPLPLRPAGSRPRFGPDGTLAIPTKPEIICKGVRLELGAIPQSPELRAQPQMLAGKAVYQMQAAAAKLQKVLVAHAMNVAIPLIPPD